MSHRTKNKIGLKLGEQAKARGDFFRKFLDKEITLTGKILALQDVLSVNFIGKSVLFSVSNIPDVDHLWIHLEEFKNFNVEEFNWNNPITIKGTVYSYTRENKSKVWHVKYSLKDVEVINYAVHC